MSLSRSKTSWGIWNLSPPALWLIILILLFLFVKYALGKVEAYTLLACSPARLEARIKCGTPDKGRNINREEGLSSTCGSEVPFRSSHTQHPEHLFCKINAVLARNDEMRRTGMYVCMF